MYRDNVPVAARGKSSVLRTLLADYTLIDYHTERHSRFGFARKHPVFLQPGCELVSSVSIVVNNPRARVALD